MFRDRWEAGRKLARALEEYKNQKDTVVLALPRGGVVLGYEIARALNLPLGLVVPRKIGAPGNPEFAIGAITESGERVMNPEAVTMTGATDEYVEQTIAAEVDEAKRRLRKYIGDQPRKDIGGKTVIVVDDGIATGYTMMAALESVVNRKPVKVVVAVPVAPPDSLKKVKAKVDEVVCLDTLRLFGAIGAFYEIFDQTKDEEVMSLMTKARDFGNK